MDVTLLENALQYILNSLVNLRIIENRVTTVPDNSYAYKYVVRDLMSGVEIIFKYRLSIENWTYVVKKIDEITIDDYENGDFNSITLDEAMGRLKKLCRIEIPENEKKSFIELKKIRNKIEHFRFSINTEEEMVKFVVLINNCLSAIIDFIGNDNENFKNKFNEEEEELFENITEEISNLRQFLNNRYTEIIKKYPNNNFIKCPNCAFDCLDIREDKETNKCVLCMYEKEKSETVIDYIEATVDYRDIANGAEELKSYDCDNCGAFEMMLVVHDIGKAICFECGHTSNIKDMSFCTECGEPIDKDKIICDNCFNYKSND